MSAVIASEKACNEPKSKLRYFDLAQELTKMLLPIEGYEQSPLLQLEEAVEPLTKIVDDLQRRVYISKLNCKNPTNGLTQDESASIRLYTLEWSPSEKSLYYILHQTLRDKNREKLKPWFAYLKLFLTALYKLPSIKATVWRGIKMDITGKFEKDDTFVWWGLSSCTESLDILESEQYSGKTGTRTLFSIECMNGKMIKEHSLYETENEILLMPATCFEVLSKVNSGHRLHIMHVREVNPPYVLIEPPFQDASSESRLSARKTFEEKFDMDAVFHAVSKLKSDTTFLDLNQKKITDEGAKVMANALVKPTCRLTDLELEGNQITAEGAKLLADALKKNKVLTCFDILGNQIGNDGAQALAETLKINQTLTTLDLAFNEISDEGARFLADALKANKTLVTLDVYGNQVGEEGAQAFADALRTNCSLRTLAFFKNHIGNKGTMALADALRVNTSLITLNIGANLISDDGAAAIGDALKVNKVLTTLCLDVNEIGDRGANAVAEGLKINKTLTSLNISQNLFSESSRKIIGQASKVHRTLTSLYFN
ncbi:unnamed protein product [Didymodactylos carnosus]|uniref:NAD(P)(+)--arginine ADP-ribosyltransferase n=1 Tax=Didymodactylos carnosus TaxID=1234261 RepID=A0A815R164_9BILA|nr:unnamed protein product [Didymodactylos carnosus]CAF1470590.1 unnamed protein product [Didymodactylos carnosus]CAF4100946.1 unnamed protein product [Didymodactylos carnosus]CAF4338430.1 unnamed protein product [Didymodactylos carnosus]